MTTTERLNDAYMENFGRGEYDSLKQSQATLDAETSWVNEVETKKMKIHPLNTPMDAETLSNDPANTIPKDILLDTVENCGLMVEFLGKKECLRDCAIPSLLSTVAIRGEGVTRPEKEQQAIALTALLTGCRDRSNIMFRSGKVAAVVSQKYEHMPISRLLDSVDALTLYLGTPVFQSGCVSHSMTVAKFTYPDAAKDITNAYRSILAAHGRTLGPGETLTPVVEFRSSDTANEAAKLLTYLQLRPGHLMPLGAGVHVNHVTPYEFDASGNRISAMQKFCEESQLLYSRLEYDLNELVPAMLDTPIEYPVNTFIGLCKKAQIPQKWGGPVEEELKADWPNGSGCTFLDIYEYLTSTTQKALEETKTAHSSRLLDLEEALARVAHNRALWTKYDMPGTVAWVQAVNQ